MNEKLLDLLKIQDSLLKELAENTKLTADMRDTLFRIIEKHNELSKNIMNTARIEEPLATDGLFLCQEEGFSNLYVDDNGSHYGTIDQICRIILIDKKIEVSRTFVSNLKSLEQVKQIPRKDERTLYNFEQILGLVDEFVKIPIVEVEFGEWRGFYEKNSDEHYGGKDAIIDKLMQLFKKAKQTMRELVAPFYDDAISMDIRGRQGLKIQGYCYEDVYKFVKDKLEKK